MKKRLRRAGSLLLAAALTFGLLCVSAGAEGDLSVEDGVKPISYQFLDADGQPATYPTSEDSFQVGTYYMMPGFFDISGVDGFYTVPEDISLKLANRGGVQDCYLTISVVAFDEMTTKELEAEYGDDIRATNEFYPEDPVVLQDNSTYYVYTETDWGGDLLCTDGKWVNGINGPENVVKVEENQTCTFTLPQAEEGKMYRVDFQAHYPQSSDPDYYYYWRFYVKIDPEAEGTPVEPEQPEPELPVFSDVAEDAWYAKQVAWAVQNGITSGTSDTTFSPDKTCSTAEILTFLWRAAGSEAPTIENPFTDVADDAWYLTPALWAYEKGIISGAELLGDTPCTRASTMVFLWKLAGSPAVEPSDFTDVADDADYAQAVAWAVQNGITSGTGEGTFSPDMICNRSQIVTFLYQNFAEKE